MAKRVGYFIAQGTALMTITSLIVKVLSAVYRVPFQNMVGNEGFYIYQQVYPIYGIGMMIALNGIPVYLSKIMVEYEGNLKEQRQMMRQLFWLLCLICFVLLVGLWFFSPCIATLMGDRQLEPLIKVVSLVFAFAPFLALWRGIYQGELDLEPTAYSQFVEQSLRVAIILIGAYCLVRCNQNDYVIGTVAMSGSLLGAIGAFIVLIGMKRKMHFDLSVSFFKWQRIEKETIIRFFKECLILSLFVSLMLVFQLIDSFVVKNQLVASGLSQGLSKNLKGIYDRGQPLVQLGLVVTNVFGSAFLPLLAKHWALGKVVTYRKTTSLMLKVILWIATPATIGLMIIMPQVNQFLFGNDEGNTALVLFVGSIWLMSLLQGMQCILQSQNRVRTLWISLFVGLLMKFIVTMTATYYLGICGASIGTLCGLIAANIVFILIERRQLIIQQATYFFTRWMGMIGVMSVALLIYEWIVQKFVVSRGSAFLFAMIGCAIGGVLYLGLTLYWNLFTPKEWLQLPFGKMILKRLGKLKCD